MGGSNSGRPRRRAYLGMLVRMGVQPLAQLKAGDHGTMQWANGSSIAVHGRPFGVELRFTCDGNSCSQFVVVDRIPCHFGGTRPLLRCSHCSRNCRNLYLFGSRFVCRTCTGAPYWTQTASPSARMLAGIRRLQKRLAPDEDVDYCGVDWVPDRPKGMREATYCRLVDRSIAAVEKRDAYLNPALLRLLARLMPGELEDLVGDEKDDPS